MQDSLLTRILFIYLGLLLFFHPVTLRAVEINSSIQDIEPGETVENPKKMTQKQMNDLFGEDPYLGQTSYLQSPDGFSQSDKSK